MPADCEPLFRKYTDSHNQTAKTSKTAKDFFFFEVLEVFAV